MPKFELTADYSPTGDQPEAIAQLTEGVLQGVPAQTLLGVTGSGKTFTIANVIQNINKPTLILSHNKHLPHNYMVSSKVFSRIMPWSIMCRIMTITNRKLTSRHRHLYRKGFGHQRRDRQVTAGGHFCPLVRTERRCSRLVRPVVFTAWGIRRLFMIMS